MPKRRYFRVSITVSHELMETLFDLLKQEDAHDFRMMELGPDGQVPQQKPSPAFNMQGQGQVPPRRSGGYERSTHWVEKHWPIFRNVFTALNGASINYKDMRLVQAIVDAGMSPASISTMMSALVKHGYIKRTGSGEYTLS